jgi:hypothetical protein
MNHKHNKDLQDKKIILKIWLLYLSYKCKYLELLKGTNYCQVKINIILSEVEDEI